MDAGLRWIDENAGELTALAREIWEYAELGLREVKSSAAQARYLTAQGFDVEHGVAGIPTALVASFGAGKPVIGFLGEYDALPGLSQQTVPHKQPVADGAPGHGCGHNLLGVGSLAAAVALKREIEAGRLKGTVRYYGCPAEETLSGKVFMAKHGLFDDLDAAITWHPMWLNTPNYCSFLANNSARFAFHGRTSHAAAAPHLGISALDAVELMNVGANYLREHVPSDARIHYVITSGGSQPNIVPDFAEVWYYVRAPRRAEVESIYQRIIKIAEGACLMTGATFEVKFQKGVYEVLPNQVVTKVIEDSLRRVGPPRFTEEEKAFARELEQSYAPGQKTAVLGASGVPSEYWDISLHDAFAPGFDQGKVLPGSTDVGDVSWVTPTGCLTTATWVAGTAAHSWQATATSGMSIGFKGMLVAAKAMALAGFELASSPDLLRQAREAFVKDTGGRPYVSPLPEGMDEPAS
jgi:aminobenzoyl-glutamate utilization protein B